MGRFPLIPDSCDPSWHNLQFASYQGFVGSKHLTGSKHFQKQVLECERFLACYRWSVGIIYRNYASCKCSLQALVALNAEIYFLAGVLFSKRPECSLFRSRNAVATPHAEHMSKSTCIKHALYKTNAQHLSKSNSTNSARSCKGLHEGVYDMSLHLNIRKGIVFRQVQGEMLVVAMVFVTLWIHSGYSKQHLLKMRPAGRTLLCPCALFSSVATIASKCFILLSIPFAEQLGDAQAQLGDACSSCCCYLKRVKVKTEASVTYMYICFTTLAQD
jgi:hypothetical protein